MTEVGEDRTSDGTPRWGPTEFLVGRHVGLVGRFTIGLIESGASTVREDLWSLVAADAPVDEILDHLSAQGLKALPAFGIAQVDKTLVRLVARGDATILVEFTDGNTRMIDPSDVRTWTEEALADVVAVSIGLDESATDVAERSGAEASAALDRYVVLAGSVPACRLIRRFDERHALANIAQSEWHAAPGAEIPSDVLVEPWHPPASKSVADEWGSVGDDRIDLDPHEVDGTHVAEALIGDSAVADPSTAMSDAGAADLPVDSNETIAARELDAIEVADLDDDDNDVVPRPGEVANGNYDFIYGHTVARSVEGAAVRPNDELSPSVLISSVPRSGGVDPIPRLGAATQRAGDHDGLTVTRADLAAMKAVPAEAPLIPGVNEVLAIFCENGHANPPHASSCRNCSRPVLSATPVPVHRPPLGVLVFSNGERVVVDRNILVGRNPRVAGTMVGELPRVMRFEDVGKGLSRTHAEIRIEGWQMLLEDLQSTNGTEVTLPGQAPRRLHAGEPAALIPGTRVDFGGEVRCTVEMVS